MKFEKLKKEIVNKLKEINPQKIILFGSIAEGNFNENSDIDICIIKKQIKNKVKEKKKIRDILSNMNFPIDIVLIDEKSYNFYKNENCSIFKDINEKGILLWKR